MALIIAKKTLAAVALAAATFATPAFAQTVNYSKAYEDCRTNTDEQVLGGVIGAVAGGVLGSQVSGNGARTEGSFLGAILGGVAGAAIADGNNDCDKIDNRNVRTTSSSGFATTRNNGFATTRNNGFQTASAQTILTTPRNSQIRSYNQELETLSRLDAYIDQLERDCAILTREQSRYYSRSRAHQIAEINDEISRLKRERRDIKRAAVYSRSW